MFQSICVLLILGVSQTLIPGILSSVTFTLVNNCDTAVWLGLSSRAGTAPLQPTSFALPKGESEVFTVQSGWSGQLWGRTHCSEDLDDKFTCLTGDCGSGKMECTGAGATPPVTLAEFTLAGDGGKVEYAVSLVDGYNLPMLVSPIGGSGQNCNPTGCTVDLNARCPSELMVTGSDGEVVACKSACGAFGTSKTCKPSFYLQLIKTACPHAYSYAHDNKISTSSCTGADYQVSFCPRPTTRKKSKEKQRTPATYAKKSGASRWYFRYIYVILGAGGASGVAVIVYVGVLVQIWDFVLVQIWVKIQCCVTILRSSTMREESQDPDDVEMQMQTSHSLSH